MSQRRIALLGLVGLLIYVCWISWPYLEAIVVRDAAVTSWVSVTAAPISGYTTDPLYPGSRAGADGRIATITDNRADARGLAEARAESIRAASRVVAQAALVDGMRRAWQTRATHADEFATTFAGDLDAGLAGSEKEPGVGPDPAAIRPGRGRADGQSLEGARGVAGLCGCRAPQRRGARGGACEHRV